MFNWLPGGGRPADEDSQSEEPPETPAHIFAVKAFKTALFGTPAPVDATTEKEQKFNAKMTKSQQHYNQRVNTLPPLITKDDVQLNDHSAKRPTLQPRHSDPLASPSKGILLSPRSVSGKRKSVSFTGSVIGGESENGSQDDGSLDTTPHTSLEDDSEDEENTTQKTSPLIPARQPVTSSAAQKEDLRRSLFQARAEMARAFPMIGAGKSNTTAASELSQENVPGLSHEVHGADNVPSELELPPGEDITIDLSSPRSRSGKHWQQEYHRDHDKSKAEMKKLIQYTQTAKSYAEKRDSDAIRLGNKLRDAETNMRDMEERVQDLASQLVSAQQKGESQEELVKEVATQTAKALRYKRKAERYRLALENQYVPNTESTDDEDPRIAVPPPSPHSDELLALRSALYSLRNAAETAEARATELEKENRALKSTMARVKDEMKKYEGRHASEKERRKQKEEKAGAREKELKGALDAVNARNRNLLKELESLRDASKDPAVSEQQSIRRKLKEQLIELGEFESRPEPTPPSSDEEFLKARHELDEYIRKNITHKDQSGNNRNYTSSHSSQPSSETSKFQTHRGQSRGSRQISTSDIWISTLPDRRNNSEDSNSVVEEERVLSPIHDNSAWAEDQGKKSPVAAPSNEIMSPLASLRRYPEQITGSRVSSLDSRCHLSVDRIAAAQKRLEEKKAERRLSSGYGKENHDY